jgi:hypothetical protein
MAKSVRDVADMLTVLVDPERADVPINGYGATLDAQWTDFRVGTLNPQTWTFPDFVIKPVPEATEQMVYFNLVLCIYAVSTYQKQARATAEAYARIKDLAGAYHEHIELRSVSDFMMGETHSIYELQGAFD